jgi:hypothetical protein
MKSLILSDVELVPEIAEEIQQQFSNTPGKSKNFEDVAAIVRRILVPPNP